MGTSPTRSKLLDITIFKGTSPTHKHTHQTFAWQEYHLILLLCPPQLFCVVLVLSVGTWYPHHHNMYLITGWHFSSDVFCLFQMCQDVQHSDILSSVYGVFSCLSGKLITSQLCSYFRQTEASDRESYHSILRVYRPLILS